MQKTERHGTILSIIGASRVSRQDELVSLLNDRGYTVTQASVSRDLDELGIVKINGSYAQPDKRLNGFAVGLISLETAGPNMIVAKCASGLASALAVRIDAEKIEKVVGTIAGDDTIFIAVASEKTQASTIKRLWKIFEERR